MTLEAVNAGELPSAARQWNLELSIAALRAALQEPATKDGRDLLAEARKAIFDAGLSISEWATANGFTIPIVKSVLYGHSKCLRGESHRVALALGIKHGVVVQAKGFVPVRRIKPPLKAVGARP